MAAANLTGLHLNGLTTVLHELESAARTGQDAGLALLDFLDANRAALFSWRTGATGTL